MIFKGGVGKFIFYIFYFFIFEIVWVKFDWKEWLIILNLEEKEIFEGDVLERSILFKKGRRNGESFVNGVFGMLFISF